ncbi:putative flagellin structural domain protein [Escherichia coli DEC5B]|nr:putative flagellin structural domain protein [Escherichia coli DEC5B]
MAIQVMVLTTDMLLVLKQLQLCSILQLTACGLHQLSVLITSILNMTKMAIS